MYYYFTIITIDGETAKKNSLAFHFEFRPPGDLRVGVAVFAVTRY